MRLNLGCGNNHRDDFINVDKYPPADVVFDLEEMEYVTQKCSLSYEYNEAWVPWPWQDSCVDEVIFNHSLEHMGESTDAFFHIMTELYRVCAPDAKITITVPHPRHDDFINDPTHVRIITPMVLDLFSKSKNEAWARNKIPNTALGMHLDVDFEIESDGCTAILDERFKGFPSHALEKSLLCDNNVIKQYTIVMRAIK